MKNTPQTFLRRESLQNLALVTSLAVGLGSGAATAETEIEYEAGQGYHEEEWYDPGDWFNEDDQISYESDTTWTDNRWNDTYDTYGIYEPVGFVHYYWDPATTDWTEDTRAREAAKRDVRSSQREMSRLNGQIDGFRQVDLTDKKGVKESHSFVKVNLKDGKSRVISLGSDKSVSDLDLEKGDRISVSGPVAKVDGRKVILADRIRTGGESYTIQDRHQPDLAKSNKWQRDSANRMMTRRGTLEDVVKVDLDDKQRDDNLVVRLEMKDGRSCVADLGAGTELSELSLDKGDTVWIQGDRKEIDGKTLIVAKKIRVEGDKTRLRDAEEASSSSNSSAMNRDTVVDDERQATAGN